MISTGYCLCSWVPTVVAAGPRPAQLLLSPSPLRTNSNIPPSHHPTAPETSKFPPFTLDGTSKSS